MFDKNQSVVKKTTLICHYSISFIFDMSIILVLYLWTPFGNDAFPKFHKIEGEIILDHEEYFR